MPRWCIIKRQALDLYKINFVAQVLEGLKDAEKGKLLTTEELLDRVDQWAK